jgi:HD-like signal output (HDOD) protein
MHAGDKKAEAYLKDVEQLPTLPTVYLALCDVVENPHSTIGDVVRVLSNDQATVSHILRLVNSAYYGLTNRIETVSRAVVLLGIEEIRGLVLAAAVINLFDKREDLFDFRPAEFWGHAIATGLATRRIGKAAGLESLENFFVSGLLHDIGKLYLFEFFEADFIKVLKRVQQTRITIGQAEQEILGTDHACIGYLLAREWRMPDSLCEVIRFHDDLDELPNIPPMLAAVHVANVMARSLELGYAGDNLVPCIDPRVREILNLPADTFQLITPPIIDNYQDVVQQLLTA